MTSAFVVVDVGKNAVPSAERSERIQKLGFHKEAIVPSLGSTMPRIGDYMNRDALESTRTETVQCFLLVEESRRQPIR